jgi:diadenosine tetraphosphate (Ap4A) HIT family hydrolase
MAALGDAIIAVTGAVRVNYGIYGNLDPFVHAHIWPRFDAEPEELRTLPPMQFPVGIREAPDHAYDPARHDALRDAIRAKLHMLRAGIE